LDIGFPADDFTTGNRIPYGTCGNDEARDGKFQMIKPLYPTPQFNIYLVGI
jgi:hypothetical protein